MPAIKGILEEGEEDMKDAKDPDVLDAGMIADAQAVEHYEIARYGTMIAWAKQLGMKDAASLLQQTLDQEYNADRLLTEAGRRPAQSRGRLADLRRFDCLSNAAGAGRWPAPVAFCAITPCGPSGLA